MSPAKAPVPSAPTRRKPIAQGTALVLNHKSMGVIPLMIWIVGWSFFVAERLCEGSRGFQPTVQRTRWDCVAARRLMRRPRIGSPGFRRRSATQSHLDDATRGLKPTATIMRSLPRPGGWSCNHELCITIRAPPLDPDHLPIQALKGRNNGGRRSCDALSGLGIFLHVRPRALPWAIVCRPVGACCGGIELAHDLVKNEFVP
jgi:hypothetical protein